MPFDASGNFTRDYNWVDDSNAGIKIESQRMDGEFDNYAAAINQTFLRTGVVPMTGNLNMQGNTIYGIGGGTLALPGLRFVNDQSTGIGTFNPGEVSIMSNGTEIIRSTASGALINGEFGVAGDILADGDMFINGAAGNARVLYFETGGLYRWGVYANGLAEPGDGSGSDFAINRYADDGTGGTVALQISRLNGLVTISGGLTVNGPITMPGTITVGLITSGTLVINGAKNTERNLLYETSGVVRWQLHCAATVESGSNNTGSDFFISRFTDAGASIDTPLWINRSTGLTTISALTVPGILTVLGAANFGGTLAINGNITQNSSGNSVITLNGPNVTNKGLILQQNGLSRWVVISDAESETGSGAGSNFIIQRFNDAGGVLDNPFVINRASGLITTNAITVNGGNFYLNGVPGTQKSLTLQNGGLNRFTITLDAIAESGANAGSSFYIQRWTDAGGYIDSPLVINRASGGVSITSTLSVTGTVSSGPITASNITATNYMCINNTAANWRQLLLQTSGSIRWGIYADNAAEGGSNAGSNFYIARYSDAAAWLDAPLQINRATGVTNITHLTTQSLTLQNNPLLITGAAASGNQYTGYMTNGLLRFYMGLDTSAEGGANTGSNFFLAACNDAGAYNSMPLTINRASGFATLNNGLRINDLTGAGGVSPMVLAVTGSNGANFKIIGNGAATPSKTIRVLNGQFQIVNDAYTAALFIMDDVGGAQFNGALSVTQAPANFAGQVNITSGTCVIGGPNATTRSLYLSTGTSNRWSMSASSTGEAAGNAGSDLNYSRFDNSGAYIDIPMQIVRSTGVCHFTQPIVNGSDMRLKKNVKPLKQALDIVERLNGVYFKSKSPGMGDKRQVGLVAQDVQEVLPEIVFEGTDEDKMLGIAYSPLVAVLVEAVKELSARVRELEAVNAS